MASFCGSCGIELPPTAAFCPQCARQRRRVSSPADRLEGRQIRKLAWNAGVAALLLTTLAGLISSPVQAQVFTEPTGPAAAPSAKPKPVTRPYPSPRTEQPQAWPAGTVGTIHIPLRPGDFETAQRADLHHQVTIGKVGGLTYDGRLVAPEELARLVARNRNDRYLGTWIRPATDVDFGQVVRIIGLFNRAQDFDFSLQGNEALSNVFGTRASGRSPNGMTEFTRDVSRQRDIPFSVSASPRTGRTCSIAMAGMPLNSDELRRNAYDALDAFMKRNWMELSLRRRENFSKAIIQAKSDTPWRCIGGALYNITISGFPVFDLVIDNTK